MWSETASFEGAPPSSAEPRGWGISVSKSGEIHLSAVTGTAVAWGGGGRGSPPTPISRARRRGRSRSRGRCTGWRAGCGRRSRCTARRRRRTGVMNVHRTMFLVYSSRRSRTGSSMAAITRCRSGASTLVAGTSAYIQAARTSAKASEPCRVNTSSSRALGSKNQASTEGGIGCHRAQRRVGRMQSPGEPITRTRPHVSYPVPKAPSCAAEEAVRCQSVQWPG